LRSAPLILLTAWFAAMPASAQEFSGAGERITNVFELPAGIAVVDFHHSGEGDFRVRLLDPRGTPLRTLAEGHGTASHAVAVRIPLTGTFLFDVAAPGEWRIRVRDDAAAAPGVDVRVLGTEDGLGAARRRANRQWLGLGFVAGLAAGPLGAGGIYLIAGGRTPGEAPLAPVDAAALGPHYREAYASSYRSALPAERRTAALVGGVVGAAANLVAILYLRGDLGGGSDEDGGPIAPEFNRTGHSLVLLRVPLR
jgi:hypothetical protein